MRSGSPVFVIRWNGTVYRRFRNRDLAHAELVRLKRWASLSDSITLEEEPRS